MATEYEIEHRLRHLAGEGAFEIKVAFHNRSDAPVTREMLASFSLAGMTPLARLKSSFPQAAAEVCGGMLRVRELEDFPGSVYLLRK